MESECGIISYLLGETVVIEYSRVFLISELTVIFFALELQLIKVQGREQQQHWVSFSHANDRTADSINQTDVFCSQ